MLKVVLDTHVWISSFFGGRPRRIIELWAEGKITICLSPAIFDEYTSVMARMGFTESPRYQEYLALIAESDHILFTAKTPSIQAVADDPDDDKFIACAVALHCDYIISGDKHLLQLQRYLHIPILSPKAFLDRVSE